MPIFLPSLLLYPAVCRGNQLRASTGSRRLAFMAGLNPKIIPTHTEKTKANMVNNLLVVLCSNKDSQPVIRNDVL